MSFLLALAVFGGWFIAAGLVALLVAAVMGCNQDTPPLLVRCADRLDQRHLLDRALAEDAQVASLDALWEMAPREPWA